MAEIQGGQTLSGSEKLKIDISKTPDAQYIDFFDKKGLTESLRHYARNDITDADVPNFYGSIRFENGEYIALVKNLEQGKIEEKQNIIRDAISKKTAGKVHELKTDIDTEKLQVKEALKDLAPDKIESSLLSTERLLRMAPQHETLLRGYAGSLILETFEKHNQRIVLKSNNEVEVNPVNQDHTDPKLLENNVLLRLKLNTLLKDGALNPDMLKIGMLYRAKSFIDYSKTVRSEDGSVMNPNDVKDPSKYFEHLQSLKQSTGYKLSHAEETLLASREGFTDFNAMLPAIQHIKDLGQIQKVAQAMNPSLSLQSGDQSSSAVGEGIGKVGGAIGKIAAAGAGGGIKVFGEILASATKEGGVWGTLAVIGGLIAAIWKGGFWKTMGAIFGIGIMSEASAGRLDLDFGTKSKDKKDAGKKVDTSKPSEGTKSAPEVKDIPSSDTNYTTFLTTAAGFAADKIQESKDMLAKFDNLTFSEIESFLKEGEGKVTASISAVLGDKINPAFAQKKAALEKYITALTKKDADGGGFGNIIEKIKQEPNYATWTMKQVQEYIFNVKERAAEVADKAELLAKKATTPEDAAAARQIGTDARDAAEKGDIEGVHYLSLATSWLSDNIANIALYGTLAYWLVNIKATDKTWRTTNWFVWLRGKSAELIKKGAKGISPKWISGEKASIEPKPEVKKPSENVAIKKTLNVDRSVLEISSLTPAEKTALESVIKKTERLSDLEDKLLVAGKTEKFGILREKITLGKEIQEILQGSPELVRKLKIAGEAGNKIAQELAIFAEKINKIEVGVLISKIIKIFKKV